MTRPPGPGSSPPPGGRRVVLHVGLPKTGTTYLQALLAQHRDALLERGVLYPFVRPQAMFLGAVEVRGSHEKFGLTAADVTGTWRALCDRVREHDGPAVISHEILGGATPDEIAHALEPLAGVDLDVVVTARDLGRQAVAHWQEEVKLGDTRSYADFEREQFRADVPAGPDRPHFWHAQDFAAALGRWSTAVPAHRVHLVVVPPPGAAPDALWRRFADGCGIAEPALGVVDPAGVPPANPTLGAAAIALLRRLNAGLDGALTPREHARLVKRGLAEGVLAAAGGTPAPRTPTALADVLVPATRAWIAEVASAGHPVHGDLADLEPVLAEPGEPHPDRVDDGDLASLATAALAAELAGRAADQRADSQRVDSGHERTGAGGGTAVPTGAVERLRRRLGVDRG